MTEITDATVAALADEYTLSARKHWKEWRPTMYRDLKKDGAWEDVTARAGIDAARQVTDLMRHGLQRFEAEEFVLREVILLSPEERLR